MIKSGTADLMKWLQKSIFRPRRVRYTSRRQVLDQAENVGAEVTFLTMYIFLR